MKKCKRSLALALMLVLMLTLALPAAAAGEASLTRGDVVLALYVVCGEAGEYPQADFDDVPAEGQLAEAVNWAAANGIILGYGNGSFGTADPVTREQLAAIIYRYVQLQGKGFQGMWMFQLDYPDAGEIAAYADEAMHWCVMNGILTGSEEGIRPKDTVPVGDAMTILQRFQAAIADTEEAENEDEDKDMVLTSGDLTLAIPAPVAELVIAEAPEGDESGVLFTVSEKASVEAAAALGEDFDGAGWLFAIRSVSGETLQELLCEDMSGVTAFARDAEGGAYLFCTPTDVRLVREGDYTEENTAGWTALNEWAAGIPAAFIEENGLEPLHRGNSDLEICLNRILCGKETYAISTLEFLSLEPGDTDPAPFAEKLLEGTYTYADEEEAPDGEYVVLQLPEENTRYDFFFGGKNLIRKVVTSEDGDYEVLYRVEFADGETTANDIMSAWYDAIAQAQGLK